MVLCQIFVGVIVLPLLIVSLLFMIFMILLLFVSLPTLFDVSSIKVCSMNLSLICSCVNVPSVTFI